MTPQLEPGQPFLAKPPLSFWLVALSFRTLGLSEFSARLPSFLMGLVVVALTYLLGSNLRGPIFGLGCALVLATTALFYIFSGWVVTDPALSATTTLSLVSFLLATRADSTGSRRIWGYLFFVGLGLTLLAKGPVGWVLVGFPVAVWTALYKEWKRVNQVRAYWRDN